MLFSQRVAAQVDFFLVLLLGRRRQTALPALRPDHLLGDDRGILVLTSLVVFPFLGSGWLSVAVSIDRELVVVRGSWWAVGVRPFVRHVQVLDIAGVVSHALVSLLALGQVLLLFLFGFTLLLLDIVVQLRSEVDRRPLILNILRHEK